MALSIYSNLWQVVLPLLGNIYISSICRVLNLDKIPEDVIVTNGAEHWDLTTLYMYLGHNSNFLHTLSLRRAEASMLT